jgi:hypothetical protein
MIRPRAPVAELVDAPDSKSGSARSAGSIPARGTKAAKVSRPPVIPRRTAPPWPAWTETSACALAHAIVERTRDYTVDALDDLVRAMDDIEQTRGLISLLTEADEPAAAAAEEKLARRKHLPGLELA